MNLPANAGDARDAGLIPGQERSSGVGSGNLLQHSCLRNSINREPWQAIVYGVAKSQVRLRHAHSHTHTHTHTHRSCSTLTVVLKSPIDDIYFTCSGHLDFLYVFLHTEEIIVPKQWLRHRHEGE